MFFIPLDSYRKIEEPNMDKKIYFIAKRYSFKKKICTKISPAKHMQNHTKNEMKNKPTNNFFLIDVCSRN